MGILSLFSGAGGFESGAIQAGGNCVASIDNDEDCIETLKLNHNANSKILLEDLSQTSPSCLLKNLSISKSDISIMCGGPPCQSFSKNNYWTKDGKESLRRRKREAKKASSKGLAYIDKLELSKKRRRINVEDDPRSNLVFRFGEYIKHIKPEGFVFENVESITHPKNKKFLEGFLKIVNESGYSTSMRVLSAEQYGVSQKRRRLIILGLKSKQKIDFPEPEFGSFNDLFLKKPIGVKHVIKKYKGKKYFETEEVFKGKWAEYIPDIPPGKNYKALSAWAGYPNPIFEAETKFWNFLLKLDPERPSWTIAANPGPWVGPFHWDNRRLRIPELAAIQSFQDGYRFFGNRRSQVKQIGNAFPPALAKIIFEKLFSIINK